MSKINKSGESSKKSIDSLRLRIPANQVQIINPAIRGSKLIVNSATGEIEAERPERSVKYENSGFSIKWLLQKQTTKDQTIQEYLVILLSAKVLGSSYFRGITPDNIAEIHKRLMKMEIALFSFEAFLAAECVDVDIKMDVCFPGFAQSVKELQKRSKKHKRLRYGHELKQQKNNLGIWWSSREKSSPGNPFLKFYSKELELLNKSKEFSEAYLSGIDFQNLVRMETTVKNKKHFRSFGITDTSLKSLINLDQDKWSEVFGKAIQAHLEKRLQRPAAQSISAKDQFILNAVRGLMERAGMTKQEAVYWLVDNLNNNKTRYNYKKKISELYEAYLKPEQVAKDSEMREEFWRLIGWL